MAEQQQSFTPEYIDALRAMVESIGPLPICPSWTYSAIRHVQRNMDFDVDDGFNEPDRQCGGNIALLINELPAILAALASAQAAK